MTPEQIEDVTRTWHIAAPIRGAVRNAVVRSYRPGAERTEERADWVLDAVERLHLLLDRPARLGIAVADLVGRRNTITTEALAEDRDALIGGLDAALGGLTLHEEEAWQQACALVWEVVSALAPSPFASGVADAG
jgi:hypothetical protein